MDKLARHKERLKWSLLMVLLVLLSPLGCKLDSVPTYGDACPPGTQVLDAGIEPHIIMDNLICYAEYFLVSGQSFNLSSFVNNNCCSETHDETGMIWKCNFDSECLGKYRDEFQLNLKTDYVNCQNYRNSNWFVDKTKVTYSVSCNYENQCEDNVKQIVYCPESYPICSFNSDRGFFCSSTCSLPLLTCPDELSENRSGRMCANPDKSIWHCGAKGSCSEESGENYKGAICSNGMICDGGVCVCPERYQKCGDVCVDIYHDPKNCGGCGNDKSEYICDSGQFCSEGRCVEDLCHSNTCSLAGCVNSSAQCGPFCINCDALPNTKIVSCQSDEGRCTVSECADGFHISADGTFCEMSTSEKCASSKSKEIKNCFEVFPHSKDTSCDRDGQCWLKDCEPGFAMVNNQCLSEEDFCNSEDNQAFTHNECRCAIGFSPCYVERDGILSVSKCVDLFTDINNCGACGHACLGGAECKQAQCQCESGLSVCYNESGTEITGCANFETDSAHCGACNHACPSGSTCQEGQCQCKKDLNVCYDESGKEIIGCADFKTDSAHCGACNHACPSGATCQEKECKCEPDLEVCYDESGKVIIGCADFQTDSAHCGECNHACPEGAICHEGQCQCDTGYESCSDESDENNTRCVDFQTDSAHCGACNHPCPEGAICHEGQCQCDTGYESCSDESDENNTRCVDLMTDSAHCGECHHPCPEGANCQEGLCQCKTGYEKCSDESDETIVLCVDLKKDINHCGECHHSCSEELTCKEGQCQ